MDQINCYADERYMSDATSRRTAIPRLLLVGLVAVLLADTRVCAQTVLNNSSDQEIVYTTLGDRHGQTTSKLFVTKGKAYIQGGKVVFGTGNHRLLNVDDRGQYVSVVPPPFVTHAMDKVWVLGFRVDEMRFHWDLDKFRKHVFMKVDELEVHDKTVTSVVSDRQQTPKSEEIILKEGRVILRGIPNLPLAPGRTYITGASGSSTAKAPSSADSASGTNREELTVKPDGTIAHQDVLVHFTSPVDAQPETLLNNATIVNDYKDDLIILEIRGVGGDRTSLVYCDKGQSLSFDASGQPVSGQGKFTVRSVRPEGQALTGWLAERKPSEASKHVKSASFEFVRDPTGQIQLKLSDIVEVPEEPNDDSASKPPR